jgi:hypothetical protein
MQSKTFPASIRGRARNFAELSLFHTAHSLEEAKKHMTSKRLLTLAGLCVLFLSGQLHAAAKIGEAAPDFTLTDSRNQTVSLGDYKGKLVVLEWTNHECPFVRKHYDSGNMQKLQRDYTGKGVVWMSIVSSAPGKQGHVTGDEAEELTRARNAAPTAVLLDPTGKTGQSYGAKTTPHMYCATPAASTTSRAPTRPTSRPQRITSPSRWTNCSPESPSPNPRPPRTVAALNIKN